jgi:hypothetical protein
MQNLTTPKAILIGLALIAAAIASLPFTGNTVPAANAQSGLTQVQLCGPVKIRGHTSIKCLEFAESPLKDKIVLPVYIPE